MSFEMLTMIDVAFERTRSSLLW